MIFRVDMYQVLKLLLACALVILRLLFISCSEMCCPLCFKSLHLHFVCDMICCVLIHVAKSHVNLRRRCLHKSCLVNLAVFVS